MKRCAVTLRADGKIIFSREDLEASILVTRHDGAAMPGTVYLVGEVERDGYEFAFQVVNFIADRHDERCVEKPGYCRVGGRLRAAAVLLDENRSHE
jgi:hypothetical protein